MDIKTMDYWQLRKIAAGLIPRQTLLTMELGDQYKQQQKGRKSNYHQYNLAEAGLVKLERVLNEEGLQSFVEVSLRAQSCPMPLNIDTWDGLKCPIGCKYCFADYFRQSLYTSFFDNGKTMGLRHCDPLVVNAALDKLMAHRGEPLSGNDEVVNAVRAGIPMRFGIRFEDFIHAEEKTGVSLAILQHLQHYSYPVMINTKSDLPGRGPYLEALANNKGKAAVHFTLISSDDEFLKKMEPNAPTFHARLEAARRLTERGVRVVARIEPWMIFLVDEKEKVDEYIGWIKEAGIQHLTFDSYSYSANSRGLAQNFKRIGMDWDRMFTLSSESQGLSSLLLGKFMQYFRDQGLKCSTFDQGNVATNDDWICCSVGDWFENFNWGSGVIALKLIQQNGLKPTRWSDFERLVISKGGWLSTNLRKEVQLLWNGEGDAAWPLYWGSCIEPYGSDQDGLVWRWVEGQDFRHDLLTDIIRVQPPVPTV